MSETTTPISAQNSVPPQLPQTHQYPLSLANLQLGTASAGMQIEGSMPPSNWGAWAEKGMVADGTSPNPTTDHWVRWKEDNQIMEDLGLQIARVGVEWSRIEPQPGQYDHAALARYAEEYQDLVDRGIQPLVTLHHFGHPLWFEERGGFTKEENVHTFIQFCRVVLEYLGPIVSDWVTINEPNVYASQAFLFNETPPGGVDWIAIRNCLRNMALAHILAYQLIHSLLDAPDRDIKVTFAHHKRVFAPLNPKNPLHRAVTKIDALLFQDLMEKAFFEGDFHPLMGKPKTPVSKGLYADAIGINYYSRTAVEGIKDGTFPDTPINDLGWELYPQGIEEVVEDLHRRYGLEVWITENGTADNTEAFRCSYVLNHLATCAASKVNFTRYYHWCFVDNWEWSEGMVPKFGIVGMDEQLNRHLKPAAHMFRDLIKAGAITQAIDDQYREKP